MAHAKWDPELRKMVEVLSAQDQGWTDAFYGRPYHPVGSGYGLGFEAGLEARGRREEVLRERSKKQMAADFRDNKRKQRNQHNADAWR